METLFTFLMHASLGMTLFYAIYWIFLRKETFYPVNRWYLLTALVLAVGLPLFPLRYAVLVEPANQANMFHVLADTFKNVQVNPEMAAGSKPFGWGQIVLIAYLTGAILFLVRLLIQTLTLVVLVFRNGVQQFEEHRLVKNDKYGLPFSFLHLIFINPKFHTEADLPEILAHEQVHIRENHWFDLLFIELLTVIFWFNPFIWFFERSIKQNHEYLADRGVLKQGHNVARYQAILLNQLMGMQIIGMTNNLNFSLNANRLKMMTKQETPNIKKYKLMWALPIVALLLFAFAKPDYRIVEQSPKKEIKMYGFDAMKVDQNKIISGTVVDENGDPLPGTSIVIKGTTTGTVADREGKFELEVPKGIEFSLVASFVGYQTKVNEVNIDEKDNALTYKFMMEKALIGIDLSEELAPPPPPPPTPSVNSDESKEVFFVVEDLPHYPDGQYGLRQYVKEKQEELKLKSFFEGEKLEGKATIGFTVSAEGEVANVQVLQKTSETAAKAGAAIVAGMEDWSPGKQRGKAVPVNYAIELEF